jgi:cystathionine beta-lyase
MSTPAKPRSQITSLIHHPYQAPDGFGAVQPAVYKASTVIFPDTASMQTRNWRLGNNYSYGLHGTPTTFILQERLATLEGGLHCLLAPSGLATISLINIALLNQGDEVLIPHNAYGPNLDMLTQILGRFNVTSRVYDPLEPKDLSALIQPNTRLLWLEAAGSVTMEFPDLSAFIKIARAHNIVTVLDNTWGAGIAFNAFDLPEGQSVDLTMHALTKYPSGGADVLMGSIVTRDEALAITFSTNFGDSLCGARSIRTKISNMAGFAPRNRSSATPCAAEFARTCHMVSNIKWSSGWIIQYYF